MWFKTFLDKTFYFQNFVDTVNIVLLPSEIPYVNSNHFFFRILRISIIKCLKWGLLKFDGFLLNQQISQWFDPTPVYQHVNIFRSLVIIPQIKKNHRNKPGQGTHDFDNRQTLISCLSFTFLVIFFWIIKPN